MVGAVVQTIFSQGQKLKLRVVTEQECDHHSLGVISLSLLSTLFLKLNTGLDVFFHANIQSFQ